MPSVVIALMFAAGVAAWTYSKYTRRTGGADTKNTMTVVAFVGVLSFLIALSILSAISSAV